jgi:cation transport regulator ChaC
VTQKTFHYFAYGSNMLTRRLKAATRAPSAEVVGTGHIVGRRLTFDKFGRDGSGKCDAEATGNETDRVYGVIFEISHSDKTALDSAEGCGQGYTKETVDVVTTETTIPAQIYIAIRKESALRPYHWYKALALAGAVEHGLPNDYVEWLRTFESKEDLNLTRRAENEALLAS